MTRVVPWCLVLLLAQASEPAPEVKAELKRHQGVWRAVSFRRDGKETAEAVARSITRTVDGDRVVWRRDGKSFSGSTIVLDPSADPKTIDIVADGGPGRDKTVRGLYKLEGDELTLCTGDPDGPRPKEFKAELGDHQTLMVFAREKPDAGP
ncbi:TIGR03067 domain-containing protein [Paludisphaera mucosa]|uniref:TIGR03067 domain-containing protein n=1 Tax=Paludisphaera mucosa TaxID=3030827 RepID=A0ABT6FK41_9BACT|nr:TIGR03067 domain-containing protein [Paludisphaera mucosa]MDG3007951.1 TIGR03067 domain-containing protein [Paludisphaera mucosa]